MAYNDVDYDRHRRPDVKDRGWSHMSDTQWPDDQDIGWCCVQSAPCT
jgi:hypothetical protein